VRRTSPVALNRAEGRQRSSQAADADDRLKLSDRFKRPTSPGRSLQRTNTYPDDAWSPTKSSFEENRGAHMYAHLDRGDAGGAGGAGGSAARFAGLGDSNRSVVSDRSASSQSERGKTPSAEAHVGGGNGPRTFVGLGGSSRSVGRTSSGDGADAAMSGAASERVVRQEYEGGRRREQRLRRAGSEAPTSLAESDRSGSGSGGARTTQSMQRQSGRTGSVPLEEAEAPGDGGDRPSLQRLQRSASAKSLKEMGGAQRERRLRRDGSDQFTSIYVVPEEPGTKATNGRQEQAAGAASAGRRSEASVPRDESYELKKERREGLQRSNISKQLSRSSSSENLMQASADDDLVPSCCWRPLALASVVLLRQSSCCISRLAASVVFLHQSSCCCRPRLQ